MNFKAFLDTYSTTVHQLPIVVLYVTEGCNLQCITCSYREQLPNELTLTEISGLAKQLHSFGLRHIVYSGGEPLLRKDFKEICSIFAVYNVKQTLLTNGLLLEKRYEEFSSFFHEIIVSIDGADEETHNGIRGIKSFDQILKGITSIVHKKQHPEISIRTVLQKRNYSQMPKMIEMAKSLSVNRISFLAADVLSNSFGRDTRGAITANESIMLNEFEISDLRRMISAMSSTFKSEFEEQFISESVEKLYHIADYFDALIGKKEFPKNICNAPDVSAVITSTGEIQPCFFLPSYGNVKDTAFHTLVNNASVKEVRKNVRSYSLERCQTCVCTLKVNRTSLLFDRV